MQESVLFFLKKRRFQASVSSTFFQTTCCNSDVTGWCVLFVDFGTAHNRPCSGILRGVSCHLTTHSPWKRSPCFYWLLMAILPTNIKDKSESLAVRGRQHREQAQVIWFYQCRKSSERKYKLLQCHSNIRHLKHMQASVVHPGAFTVLFNAILYRDWL